MIAAIYARKSTDQYLPDAEKSVTNAPETVEAFADLRTMLEELTEEQASCIRLGVLSVRTW